MIAITGATGLLGQHVIENLLQTVPANQIVAFARDVKKRIVFKSERRFSTSGGLQMIKLH